MSMQVDPDAGAGLKKDVDESGDRGTKGRPWLSLSALLADIDEEWPSLKFLGFGCYYAWIWLCYDSDVLVPAVQINTAAYSVFDMYLLSTASLAVVLIASSVFASFVERALGRSLVVLTAGLVAALGTVAVGLASSLDGGAAFVMASVLTGVGTALVALRLGMVYGTVPARQAIMYTAASFVFSGMLYFVAIGLPPSAGLVFMSLLPLLAAVCSVATLSRDHEERSSARRDDDRSLRRGFFVRFVLAVSVFATVVGVTRGYSALAGSAGMIGEKGVIIVAGASVVAIGLFVVAGMLVRDFDISKLYYPATILVSVGVLLMPVISSMLGQTNVGTFESQVIGVAYALFIMVIWCMCAHVSYMTGLSAVRVFGWGRGASAAGNTIGWLLGAQLVQKAGGNSAVIVSVSVVMVFILLIVVMLVFNDRAMGRALRQANDAKSDDEMNMGSIFPSAIVEGTVDEAEESHRRPGAWSQACNEVADECRLSVREREVLFLLAKGRSIEYVHTELGISVNTAKTHIKNVYAKLGVHTRQELINLVEQEAKEFRH